MKLTNLFILLLILFSCNLKTKTSKKVPKIIEKIREDSVSKPILSAKPQEPRHNFDTLIAKGLDSLKIISPILTDSVKYTFWKIKPDEYDFLRNYVEYSQIPRQDYSNVVTINKKNLIIRFENGKTDTLWNELKTGGVDYSFGGNYCSDGKYLIISEFDGEAGFYTLVDLVYQKYYGLYSMLRISPNNNLLVSYNNNEINPLQGTGLMIIRFDTDMKKIDFETDELEYEIKNFEWISDDIGILKLELFDWNENEVTDSVYSLMRIEKYITVDNNGSTVGEFNEQKEPYNPEQINNKINEDDESIFDNSQIPINLINFIESNLSNYNLPDNKDYPDYYFSGFRSNNELPYFCSGMFNNDSLLDYAMVLIKDSVMQELISFHTVSNGYEYYPIICDSMNFCAESKIRIVDYIISVEKEHELEAIDEKIIIPFDGISFTDMFNSTEWLYVWDTIRTDHDRILFD